MNDSRRTLDCGGEKVPVTWVHTLVVGSGAAGLNAACQLDAKGVKDLLLLSEGLKMGTSINTGSDKQTYYKISTCGEDNDSPLAMAKNYFDNGSMHGDLALAEAAVSARAFFHLVSLGVPFPQDSYGQFVGYKTDHDPRRRATSIGPYTSKQMCLALTAEVKRRDIRVREKMNIVDLLTLETPEGKRAGGVIAISNKGDLEVFATENLVLAVGGPGGIYKTSVYPKAQTGAIGLAFMEGALSQSLAESQFGLSSIKFRWNVSGSFMQVVPRFISTDKKGNDEKEFLLPYFKTPSEMCSNIFLKGYQWPFDAAKLRGGSSIIDILVYIETVQKDRRVFLDFRRNPTGYQLSELSDEARCYLENSGSVQDLPIKRLEAMNPNAIALYQRRRIDIRTEPLEVDVCAQHNNGGLAVNHWWESLNIQHLFSLGETAGTHGAARPGGAALNAGQVGGFRIADFIAHKYTESTLDKEAFCDLAQKRLQAIEKYLRASANAEISWVEERAELQQRMTTYGSAVRSLEGLDTATAEAWNQWKRISRQGGNSGKYREPRGWVEALRNRHLCFAHLVYLEALRSAVKSGQGSRGSAVVLAADGKPVHELLDEHWRMQEEDKQFREQVMETVFKDDQVISEWVPCRPIPQSDLWFETAWARFKDNTIYE